MPLIFQSKIYQAISPGALMGITHKRWRRLLAENHFEVEPKHRPRIMLLHVLSLFNSMAGWMENLLFASAYRKISVPPPLFVLGIARSGTSFLHNLLSQDHRFSFPNLYQIRNPHTFLLTEPIISRLTNFLISGKRLQDNVAISWNTPDEDQFAIMLFTLKESCLGKLFPKKRDYYEKFATFNGCTQDEIDHWKEAVVTFLQKLTWKDKRPLVLKSPSHTGKVRLLLELFPQAKFIHIHRHPYDVYRSETQASKRLQSIWAFQHPVHDPIAVWTNSYNSLYEAFLHDKELIPPGNYHEVRYGDLVQDPINHIREAYKALDLPDFELIELDLAKYVESIKNYKKNRHPGLTAAEKKRIHESCRHIFKLHGYAK